MDFVCADGFFIVIRTTTSRQHAQAHVAPSCVRNLSGTCSVPRRLCCRERKWKIAQAKRFAKLVSKSNLDVEGRERSRRKEELLNLKKRAAWIAKEVLVSCSIALLLWHLLSY